MSFLSLNKAGQLDALLKVSGRMRIESEKAIKYRKTMVQ